MVTFACERRDAAKRWGFEGGRGSVPEIRFLSCHARPARTLFMMPAPSKLRPKRHKSASVEFEESVHMLHHSARLQKADFGSRRRCLEQTT